MYTFVSFTGPIFFSKPIYLCRYAPGTQEAALGGEFLADGFFAVLWVIAGDLDYLAKTLSMPRWSLAVGCCILCKCQKNGPDSWQDCRLDAPWTERLWTAQAWRNYADRSRNRLFTLPGVTGLTIALDYMHCKYLGSDQYMIPTFVSCIVCVSVTYIAFESYLQLVTSSESASDYLQFT